MSVAILFGILKHLSQNHIQPQHNLYFMISTYEEVGHGSSYIDHHVDELIAVDMGCIGKDLSCSEYDVSICAKDSSDFCLVYISKKLSGHKIKALSTNRVSDGEMIF